LGITNLRTSSNKLHTFFYNYVLERNSKSSSYLSDSKLNEFQSHIKTLVSEIEKRCTDTGASPADLAVPSFRIFLWLRFLTDRENLKLHINALGDFLRILSDLKLKSIPDPHYLLLKLTYSSYLYQRKTAERNSILQINESLISAPDVMKKSVLSAAFSKRRSQHNQIIRDFITTLEYLRMNERIRGKPIANKITCRGNTFFFSRLY